MVSTRRGDSRAPGISGNESVSWQSLGLPNLQCPHLPLIDCTFLRSACCASDKLTDLLAKGQNSNGAISLQYIHSKAALSVEQITFSEERLFSVPFRAWGRQPCGRARLQPRLPPPVASGLFGQFNTTRAEADRVGTIFRSYLRLRPRLVGVEL